MVKKSTNLSQLVRGAISKVDELKLTEEEINMLELCRLIVDIEYKSRYGKSLGKNGSIMYTESKQSNQVLTDQIPPVDNSLSGSSTGDTW